jgi:hypothetical protein
VVRAHPREFNSHPSPFASRILIFFCFLSLCCAANLDEVVAFASGVSVAVCRAALGHDSRAGFAASRRRGIAYFFSPRRASAENVI